MDPPDESLVDAFKDIPPFLELDLIPKLKAELKDYISVTASYNPPASREDEFTESVLHFWATNKSKFETWAIAARITFSFSPSSAACERVFFTLKAFHGNQRDMSLADQVECSLMLAYNKRKLG